MTTTTDVPVLTSTVPGAAAARTVDSVNPADLWDVVARVELAGPEVLVEAARRANAAQREWAGVPAPVRGRVIAAIGRLVEANAEALAQLVTREVGKPLAESRGEVQEIVDTCDFFLGEGRRLYGQTVPSEMPDKQLFTFRVPVGTAVIVTAGNFPVAVPSWYLVPALLAGNAVVWKPAEYAAATADALARVFVAGGLPEGLLTVVHADGPATFAGLEQALDAGLVGKVGFTGSTDVGRRIGELCGRLPAVALSRAGRQEPHGRHRRRRPRPRHRGRAVRRLRNRRAAVHEPRHGDRARVRARGVRALVRRRRPRGGGRRPPRGRRHGPPARPPLRRALRGLPRWIGDHHQVHGSHTVGRITAANPREGFVGDPATGLYYHPVIVDGVRPDDELFRTETFGPIVGVTTYRTLDEAIELANLPGYGLSSSIYTTNPTSALRFRQGIGAGMVSVNNSTSGAEAHLPFGGNGKSGNGSRQSGVWVLDQFTRWQSMNWDYSGRLQKAQMDVEIPAADTGFRL